MHLRRALLLLALVLGITALVAAVSPSTRDTTESSPAPAALDPIDEVLPRPVVFEVRSAARPQVLRVRAGEHLDVRVRSALGGLVTMPRLGRTATVSPAAPARFDVLAPAPGRYDVLFAESGGGVEPRRVGTLVTRP